MSVDRASLIVVRIQRHAALLIQHHGVMLGRIESNSAEIASHIALPVFPGLELRCSFRDP
jgi:hypothetical protein